MTSLHHCIGMIIVAQVGLILGCNQDKWDPPVPTEVDEEAIVPQVAVSATPDPNDESYDPRAGADNDKHIAASSTAVAATPQIPADKSQTEPHADDDTESPTPDRTPAKRVPRPNQSEPPPQTISRAGSNSNQARKAPPRPSSPLTMPQQKRLRELRAKRSLADKVAVSKERRMVGDFD